MSRGAVVVLLGLIPIVRAVSEAYDAAVEIGRLLGPGHVLTEVAGWELGAHVGWAVGLGIVGTHCAAGSSVAEPERTEGIVYLGPLTLTVSRERLPEVAPLVRTGAAA